MPRKKSQQQIKVDSYILDDVRACIGLLHSIQNMSDSNDKLSFIYDYRIQPVVDTMKVKIRKNSIENCLADLQKILDKHTTKHERRKFIESE